MTSENLTGPTRSDQTVQFSSSTGQGELGKVIDVEAALARMGRDRGLLRDVAQFFIEDAPGLLAQVRSAASARSGPDIGQAAHSLKGLVSNFDAIHAQRLAAEIEQLGFAGRVDEAGALLDRLEQEVVRAMEAVRAEILSHP